MALQIYQWEKLISGKSVPVFRPSEVFLGKNKPVEFNGNIPSLKNLKSCWQYFAKNYKCYFVERKLYQQFGFKKSTNHKKKVSGTFSLPNNRMSGIDSHGFYYVSDSYGFAILHVDVCNKVKILL